MDYVSEYDSVIATTLGLLKTNNEWIERYNEYINTICEKQSLTHKALKALSIKDPLYLYSSISRVTNAGNSKITFDIRYQGQSVASTKLTHDSINEAFFEDCITNDEKNSKYYNGYLAEVACIPQEDRLDRLKIYFSQNPNRISGAKFKNDEHRFESLILTLLSRLRSADKPIPNIQPVELLGCRFQMPTPLSASKAKKGISSYSAHKGGGIDILARTGRGPNSRITVIELKDECDKDEKPQQAIKQALMYAVFIRQLIRESSRGNLWYALFNTHKQKKQFDIEGKVIPRKLAINAVIMMPFGEYNDREFSKYIYTFPNGDSIQAHYIYFNRNDPNAEPDTSIKPYKTRAALNKA